MSRIISKLAAIRDSEKPKVKWYFWKIWLAGVAYFLLTTSDWGQEAIPMPVYEGYWVIFASILMLLMWVIPLIWMFKFIVWLTFNLANARELLECVLCWLVMLGIGGLAVFWMLPAIISNVMEEKVTIVVDDYHVRWLKICERETLDSSGCTDIDGYFLFLDAAETQRYEINKSTHDWLQNNQSSKKVTRQRMTRMEHSIHPVLLTYQPKSKIVYRVEPLLAEADF